MATNAPVVLPLGTTETITIAPIQQKTLSSVTINRIVDLQGLQTVKAFLQELPSPLTLWSPTTSPSYSQVGDWTQDQAQARILVVLAGMV